MSDERIGDHDVGSDEWQSLPPDAQALYRHLSDEGAAWRAATPELARVGERLRERAEQLTLEHREQARTDTAVPPRIARGSRSITLPPAGTVAAPPPHTPARRVGGWLGGAAAVAIVGALAALLLTAGPGRHTGTAGPTTTGTPAVQHGRWVSLDALAANAPYANNDLPAIAPTDPRVVYETFAYNQWQAQDPNAPKPVTLRRTDDGGATWHALAVPVPAAHVSHAGFLVSPLAAHTIFLSLFDTQGADCPAGAAQPLTEAGAGSVYCWLEYTSTDGGAHWTMTNLPMPNAITPNLTNNSATSLLAALGPDGRSRLYALLGCPGAATCTRLVVSADGGLSWQYADGPLMADGATDVCSTTADLRGTAVYAVTTAGADCNWRTQAPLTLWRSDDAGAHWTALGPLATPNLRGLELAHAPSGGRPLLYAAEPRTTAMTPNKMGDIAPTFSADPSDLKVSIDGGATWTSAPDAGIPAGFVSCYDICPHGTLSDGSFVARFMPGPDQRDPIERSTLLAWRPGDAAWRQLAPPLTSDVGGFTTVPAASGVPGDDTLYAVTLYYSGGDPRAPDRPTFSFLRYDP